MESPADVVAVLDSDVSSVSDPVNGADPANVLQTQKVLFHLRVSVCMAVTLEMLSAAVICFLSLCCTSVSI